MRRSDLPAAEAIAEQVHPDLPEEPSVFAERLHLFATGCLMLEHADGCVGYAVSHPWLLERPPMLNSLLGQLPDVADTLFLHDLALLPDVRGGGHAAAAVRILTEQTRRMALPAMSLIAVGASHTFWRHMGFRPFDPDGATAALASYGPGARAMVRRLPPLP